MSRKDFYHDYVRAALITAGWTITKESFILRFFSTRLYIDFAAERVEEDGSRSEIVVEVKNFRLREDYVNEFQKALGQCLLYEALLIENKLPHTLYLAIPQAVYKTFFQDEVIQGLIETCRIRLIIFDPLTKTLIQWNA